jgi:hypothetical protein
MVGGTRNKLTGFETVRMDNKDKLYWIQFATHPNALDELVTERIKEHWEPYGSPFIATEKVKDTLFCQAMVRGGIGRGR